MPARSTARLVRHSGVFAIGALLAVAVAASTASDLRGTTYSLSRQNTQARRHDFTFINSRTQLQMFVDKGYLVPVRGDQNYSLKSVSFPYSRPEVKLFIERLSEQYRTSCGEQLIVTSLTRPKNHQPRNASPRSVHPTGMALDLRRSNSRSCRNWLEKVLVSLEKEGVLEATYERWPPHYHIAVYPRPYSDYVDQMTGRQKTATYRVSHGDTLWQIANRHRTTVSAVIERNELRSNRIYPGQVLEVPVED